MAMASSYNAGNIYEIYPDGLKRGEKIADAAAGAVGKVKDTITSGFSLAGWIRENWPLALIGVLAVVLLLRR